MREKGATSDPGQGSIEEMARKRTGMALTEPARQLRMGTVVIAALALCCLVSLIAEGDAGGRVVEEEGRMRSVSTSRRSRGATEPGEEHEGPNVWPFLLISVILLLSMGFETIKGYIESQTPEAFEPITDAFFSELATLGFIGAIAFTLTYNFDSACEGPCSVMQRLSQHFVGEPMELQELFETLHFMLFAVSIVFIFVVLMLLHQTTTGQSHGYMELEGEVKKVQRDTEIELKRSQRAKFEASAGGGSGVTNHGGFGRKEKTPVTSKHDKTSKDDVTSKDESLTAPLLGQGRGDGGENGGGATASDIGTHALKNPNMTNSVRMEAQARETHRSRLQVLMCGGGGGGWSVCVCECEKVCGGL